MDIEVTVADSRTGNLEFHQPGCAHLSRLRDPRTSVRSVEWLRSVQTEAKDLGTANPLAPCLRKAVR
jgi:hypothetical protein